MNNNEFSEIKKEHIIENYNNSKNFEYIKHNEDIEKVSKLLLENIELKEKLKEKIQENENAIFNILEKTTNYFMKIIEDMEVKKAKKRILKIQKKSKLVIHNLIVDSLKGVKNE